MKILIDKYNVSLKKYYINNFLLALYGLLIVIHIVSRSALPIDNMAIKLGWLLSSTLFVVSFLLVKHTQIEYTWLLIGGVIALENYWKTG